MSRLPPQSPMPSPGVLPMAPILAPMALILAALACGPLPSPGEGASPGGTEGTEAGAGAGQTMEVREDTALLVPPGYGTLRQDDITLHLQRGDLLIKVTPLEEWVIRLTAPDTYERLRGLARAHGPRATSRASASRATLFLVSLFSYEPDVTYQPEDLLLVNRGLRYRPRGIAPVTPSWGTQRLAQQETRMAVYAFDGDMDLETDLVVEYEDLRNDAWRERIVPLLEAERAKVKARAG